MPLKDTYLPQARDTAGYGDLPDGKRWYQQLIQLHTTLPLSADELHEFGLAEVVMREMTKVKETVGYQ